MEMYVLTFMLRTVETHYVPDHHSALTVGTVQHCGMKLRVAKAVRIVGVFTQSLGQHLPNLGNPPFIIHRNVEPFEFARH